MKTFELKGEVRTDLGKKSSKAARVGESVPCVLYGGAENVHFTCTASDLRKLIYSPDVFVVELEVAGKKCNAVMKALQFHPVTDKVLHIDFLQVTETKPVVVEIPVKLEGLAEGDFDRLGFAGSDPGVARVPGGFFPIAGVVGAQVDVELFLTQVGDLRLKSGKGRQIDVAPGEREIQTRIAAAANKPDFKRGSAGGSVQGEHRVFLRLDRGDGFGRRCEKIRGGGARHHGRRKNKQRGDCGTYGVGSIYHGMRLPSYDLEPCRQPNIYR